MKNLAIGLVLVVLLGGCVGRLGGKILDVRIDSYIHVPDYRSQMYIPAPVEHGVIINKSCDGTKCRTTKYKY